MQPKEKSFNISLLRTLSTIIIVVFHVLFALSPGEGKTYFPLYIGVPIFLFISGFLYANKKIDSVKRFYKNNILKIAVPTLLFLILYCAAIGIYSLCTGTAFISLFYDFSGGGTSVLSIGHLWFIPAIILCYLILPLLSNIYNKKYSKTITSLCIIFLVILEFGCIILGSSVMLPFVAGFIIQKKQGKSDRK